MVSLIDGAGANDQFTIAGVAQGSIDLDSDTFINLGQADFTASTLSLQSGMSTLSIVLGPCSGDCAEITRGDRGTVTFVVDPAVTDPAGIGAVGTIVKTFRPF